MDLYLLLVIIATLLCSRIFSFVYAKLRVQENKIIAYSPSSSSPPSRQSSLPRNWTHDVFPSFHGADVRKSFLSHLLKECRSKGINLFIDNEITRGEFIGPELKKAIQGSRIAIVLLSKRYASSSWCLDELVEIMKCKEDLGPTVMPVFYEVDPSDVKKQAGEFGKVFKKTCKGKTNKVTRKWSEALAKVATLAGYHSNNWDNDAKMIEDVATDVANKLFNSTPPRYFDEFIGMEAHMNKISPVLRTDLDEVRMIGIWGPAGIGKTTIARCLFNQLSHSFQYSVFLMNVKAMYTPPICSDDHNVKLLFQQKFLSQILNQKEDFEISHLGVAQERLSDKKVLVVLDNVDRLVQLEAMAKETGWFGHGSRIIITTQDRKILKAHGITHIYKVDFPSDREAIQMFCMYAFGQKSPEDGFENLVWAVTRLVGKLPLGLRVMGSHFRGMAKQEGENELPELWRCLDGEIESILMFSYNALSQENKDLFLHIACIFNLESIERMVEYLSKIFPDVRQRLNVLAEKSFISLESELVSMHDLLVQLGRDIVRKQSSEPGQRQFLVDKRETCEVLSDDAAGSGNVIGIKFDGDEINVSERAFEGMSNLQFLRLGPEIDNGGDAFHLFGGQSYLSRKLRLLNWSYFPLTCLHCIPKPELLVELIMPDSKLERLWERTKPLSNLKWVDLAHSKNLKDVFSLSTATSLQELNLRGCSSLVELPSSIGNAIHLKKLNLTGCSSLLELPSSIGNATNLQFLSLSNCSSLVELPSSIGNAIGNLEHLYFSDCSSLVGVPSSIGNATNLRNLDFSRCSSLVELPASIGNLQKLDSLILRECCKLEALPVNIIFKSLMRLDLTDCSLMKSFPEISTNIKYMHLAGTAIKEVPSSIRLWPRLDVLHMSYNEKLKEFPHVLDIMTDLVMSNTEIQEISPWIERSSRLDRLVLTGCKQLLSLPQLPSSLSQLDAEDCESLERLDCSFLNQKIDHNFAKCFKLNKEARDVIIKSSTNKVTFLPGKEMPNYFNYQANGGSLVMKLNERPSSSSMIWKACILLVRKDEVEAGIGQMVYVHHGIKQNSLDVPCSPRNHTLFRPLTEHLYIFEFEADVTSDELCFEFRVNKEEWMIKECGVHYVKYQLMG
ncbi:PREDICTED: probable disease resistance protein RPP1 [Brassica oleracea var. oleracea]|uniref:ADP-ribosyl cyclase/cyclic ADP-ribose hydrolase n=1 Tax=Brassica oleracea var. oleracea TaxID=109376 RepID=A0A0D3CL59_BRAOL|nr:PREDICTED: probable disease resistance protein RPP1 [Brassica oleracea var. oleracea]